MLLELIIMTSLIIPQSVNKQYYQFNAGQSFPENTIFERNGDEFTPIMGSWDENSFKKRSGGQGFDKVKKLNTNFEEVMKVNPTWKQKGVILPEGINYELHGKPISKHYENISDVMSLIKNPKKKYKFVFSDDFKKTLEGVSIVGNSDTNPAYKKIKDNIKNPMIGGGSADIGDYFEVRINDKLPIEQTKRILSHEIAHTLFDDAKVPNELFLTNRTYGHYQSFQDFGKTMINKKETIADHFSDYADNKILYKSRYPKEAEFFDKFLNKLT